MFGLWYITFVFVAVSIGLFTYITINKVKEKYYVEKRNYYEQQIEAIQKRNFKNGSFLSKEDFEKLDELGNERNKFAEKLKKIREHDDYTALAIAIVCSITAFTFGILSFLLPITAQSEVNYYIQQKEYVELAIENGEALENIAITQIIIENNEWLAQAKASKLTHGCFSRFYNIDLSNLEPITVQRK